MQSWIITSPEKIDTTIDIITKIDSFYNNAWSKLVLFWTILFAVVGVFVPLVLQWYQKRVLALSEESIKTKIKKDLEEELMKKITLKFEENEKKINNLNASANAKIFYSQAKFNIERWYYKAALWEIVLSWFSWIECEDFKIIQEILDFLLKNCLNNLSIEEINDLKTANVCDLNSFLEKLSSIDDRAMFQTKIWDIKVLLTKLPISNSDKPEQKQKI